MLHQLRNGNWITLADVRQIVAEKGWPAWELHGAKTEGRCPEVVVWFWSRGAEWIEFDSFADACAYRDELAGLVNAVKVKEEIRRDDEREDEFWRNLNSFS